MKVKVFCSCFINVAMVDNINDINDILKFRILWLPEKFKMKNL